MSFPLLSKKTERCNKFPDSKTNINNADNPTASDRKLHPPFHIFSITKAKDHKSHLLPIFAANGLENTRTFKSLPNFPYEIVIVYWSYSYHPQYHKFILPARIINTNRLWINDIINAIETYDHIETSKHSLSYYVNTDDTQAQSNPTEEHRMFCLVSSSLPLDNNYLIENPIDKVVYLKLRVTIDRINEWRLELYEDDWENQDENKEMNHFVNKNSKRAKERKIGYIWRKVFWWKKLCEGVDDKNGKTVKMTLQDAALKVEISKKSWDEYWNQIRLGKKFGFDFNKHKNDKVGVLRGFVKMRVDNMEKQVQMESEEEDE